MMRIVSVGVGCVLLLTRPVFAQEPDGSAVFQKACASCHVQPPAGSRAPDREALRQLAPEVVLTALTTGTMFRNGAELTPAERRAVAAFIAGRPVGAASPASTTGRCNAVAPAQVSLSGASNWNGWGASATNTRYQSRDASGLAADQVPRLKLKWSFGFPGVSSARSQPAIVSGRLFVGSESGDLFALDAKTGCTYWVFHAKAGIRTAISVGLYTSARGDAVAVYFADGSATAYAVDAATGTEIWSRKVDDHPYAKATGSPTLHAGRLYVPVAGVGEEGQGGRSQYECCTFRGSVSAIDANTGRVIWKTYSIAEEPKPRSKNKDGVQTWGPAGAGVWSSPTVDAGRRAIYFSTGNGYAEPAQPTSDAVIALDMDTGRMRWRYQPTPNDVFAGGCRAENPDNPNCPAKQGPDFDFSASPMLAKRANGQDVVLIQQKSGMAYALDPDKDGAVVWQYRTHGGNGLGGQWGGAVDGRQAYWA